jgi:hypothetical protein
MEEGRRRLERLTVRNNRGNCCLGSGGRQEKLDRDVVVVIDNLAAVEDHCWSYSTSVDLRGLASFISPAAKGVESGQL